MSVLLVTELCVCEPLEMIQLSSMFEVFNKHSDIFKVNDLNIFFAFSKLTLH